MRKKEIGYIASALDVDMNPPLTAYSFVRLRCSGRRSLYLAAQLMSVFSYSASKERHLSRHISLPC